jgi:cytochrome oxidase Cu insertion factor (SCO1/SenC/PrrC family)
MLNQTDNKTPVNKSNGRKILLGMAVIFVLPFTIAKTMHLLNMHPTSHSYGTLVNPPHALTIPALQDVQGKAIKPQQWLKIWSIVTIDATGCAEACQAQIHLLKQVHTSLDKDIKRVRRVLLAPSIKADTANALQKQYPDLIILAGADAQSSQFMAEFNTAVNTTVPPKGRVYLVDPLGNLMMSYPADMNPKGMQTDLKKLLKNSWAG